jgi:hypothetical protein
VEALTIELLQPAPDSVECGKAGDVIDEERAERAAVVGGGDGAKALLTNGVLDLAARWGWCHAGEADRRFVAAAAER